MDAGYAVAFTIVLISSHLIAYWRYSVPCPDMPKTPETMEIINDFHGLEHLTRELYDTLPDQALKDKAEYVTKGVSELFQKVKSACMKNTSELYLEITKREAKLKEDEGKLSEKTKNLEKKMKESDTKIADEREKLDKMRLATLHSSGEERRKLEKEKAAFEKESESKKKIFVDWESRLKEMEERIQLKKDELNGKETKIKEDKDQFKETKGKAVNAIRYVFFTIVLGGVVMVYCLKMPRAGSGVSRSSERRGGGGMKRSPERQVAADVAAELDICHLSRKKERNLFFEKTLLPRLAESNIRPRTKCCLLTQPADFDDIPPARCYIVHWTAQRMSIHWTSWHHQGLLRALGDSPVMIFIHDSENISTLPDPKIYDGDFQQIETEGELRDAARERRLMTYRGNEQFNRTQNQTLRNWVNANIGDALNMGVE